MGKESYKIEVDNFEGDVVCSVCPKLNVLGECTVYGREGMKFRSDNGYCPVVNRYASWHKDKPIPMKARVRVGQGKTKQGGNK